MCEVTVDWAGKARLHRLHDIPIKALNNSSRKLIGRSLDTRVTTFSRTNGTQQDWEGLAELMGWDYDEIQALNGKEEKTVHLLQHWSQKTNSTIGRFIKFIEDLERFDILENEVLQDRIVADVAAYHTKQAELREASGLNDPPIQVDEVNSTLTSEPCGGQKDLSWDTEFKNITVGEVATGVVDYFDAYVCHAKGDMNFVKQMIDMLEGHHGLKLCVSERDLTLGSAEYTIVSHLMSQRCKKVIIIVSPRFARCSACDFMTKFAQSLDPGARSKKLIPIVIQQPCTVPEILRFITMVDYTRCELVEWFWGRIAYSLKESSFINVDTLYGQHILKTKPHLLANRQRAQPIGQLDSDQGPPTGTETPPISNEAPPTMTPTQGMDTSPPEWAGPSSMEQTPPTMTQAQYFPQSRSLPGMNQMNQTNVSFSGVVLQGPSPVGLSSAHLSGAQPYLPMTQYNTVSINHSMTEPITPPTRHVPTNQASAVPHMIASVPSVTNSTEPLLSLKDKVKRGFGKKKKKDSKKKGSPGSGSDPDEPQRRKFNFF